MTKRRPPGKKTRAKTERGKKVHAGSSAPSSLQMAAWPNALENLQSAYRELAKTRNQLEDRVGELNEARDLFEQVVESMAEAFFLLDVSGRVVKANDAARVLLERSRDSIVGQPLIEVCPALDVPTTPWAVMERSSDGHLFDLDAELERNSGGRTHLSVSASVVRSDRGRIKGTLIVARDITDRHRVTEELARSNRELEVFAHVASHDLQEPLRMIASYLQLIEEEYEPILDEAGKEYIGFAVDGAMRMQQLILGLLAYSRVGTKPLELTPLESRDALDKALANLKLTLDETAARIDIGSLPRIVGDEVRLVQLFQNLVGNALKFRGDDVPRVTITASPDERHFWRFDVGDNGIGMDAAFSERVFQIFQRLGGEKYPGTGLGLAICKKTVERHGGRIWVTSSAGKGATFSFTLPGVPEREDDAAPPGQESPT